MKGYAEMTLEKRNGSANTMVHRKMCISLN